MLKKLLKHEYRATYKLFLSIYAGLLLITLVTLGISKLDLFSQLPFSTLKTLFLIAMVLGCIALPIGSVIYIMYRFYKNLFSDEGYLTFTLPVTRMQIILSKFITGCTWFAGSLLVTIGSLFLYFGFGHGFTNTIDTINDFMHLVIGQTFDNANFVIFSLILYGVCYVVYIISFVYMAFAFGQFIIPNHKIAGAILSYFILQMVMQLISVIIMGVYMVFTSFSLESTTLPSSYFFVFSLILLVMTFVWLFLTNLICKKNLNLS